MMRRCRIEPFGHFHPYRAQAETDFQVNLKNEVNIETLLRELGELRSEAAGRLDRIEQKLADR